MVKDIIASIQNNRKRLVDEVAESLRHKLTEVGFAATLSYDGKVLCARKHCVMHNSGSCLHIIMPNAPFEVIVKYTDIAEAIELCDITETTFVIPFENSITLKINLEDNL